MEPIIITIVCFAIALALWLLLKTAALQDDEPKAKPPPPFPTGWAMGRWPVLILLLAVMLAGCGAREHRDNLGEVQKLQAEIKEREAAEKRRQKGAIAEAAMEQREARKEVQDARRNNAQVIAEMEAAD